jgi:hypothetical protein
MGCYWLVSGGENIVLDSDRVMLEYSPKFMTYAEKAVGVSRGQSHNLQGSCIDDNLWLTKRTRLVRNYISLYRTCIAISVSWRSVCPSASVLCKGRYP